VTFGLKATMLRPIEWRKMLFEGLNDV